MRALHSPLTNCFSDCQALLNLGCLKEELSENEKRKGKKRAGMHLQSLEVRLNSAKKTTET